MPRRIRIKFPPQSYTMAASAGAYAVAGQAATLTGPAGSIPTVTATLEDWTGDSYVSDVATLTVATALRTNVNFENALLAADVAGGWDEYGPGGTEAGLPTFGGIRWGAKLQVIKPGGVHTGTGYRLHLMAKAIDLASGQFGPLDTARTIPPAFKFRIKQDGVTVKVFEMRDGLPINASTLVQLLTDATTSPVRPWVNFRTALTWYGGAARPFASTAVRNLIPRAKNYTTGVRKTVGWPYATNFSNSREYHYNYNTPPDWLPNNGHAHPGLMPQWAMSRNAIAALDGIASPDTTLVNSSNAGQWTMPRVFGWDTEPGSYGQITRRRGPGGVRADRTSFPAEFFNAALSEPSGTHPHHGASYVDMADAYIRNHGNYPGFVARDLVDLRPIAVLGPTQSAPVPAGQRIKYVRFYYSSGAPGTGGADLYVEDPAYGGTESLWAKMAGWSPDTEHNHLTGLALGAMWRAEPAWAFLHDFLASEAFTVLDFMASASTYWGALERQDPIANTFGSRTFMGEMFQAMHAWMVSTTASVNNRASIEAQMRAYIVYMQDNFFGLIPGPGSETTPGEVGWNRFKTSVRYYDPLASNDTSVEDAPTAPVTPAYGDYKGWTLEQSFGTTYLAEFLVLANHWGFRTAMETGGTSTENTKVQAFFSNMQECLRSYALMFTSNPAAWAPNPSKSGTRQPGARMRSFGQGATTAIATIPGDLATCIGNYTPRTNFWQDASGFDYMNAGAGTTAGTNANTTWRIRTAQLYWEGIAPANAEKAAEIGKLTTILADFETYLSTTGPTGPYYLFRPFFTQSLPAAGF